MKTKQLPDLEILQKFLAIDLESPSGLRWKVARRGTAQAGGVAGRLHHSGYWTVKINGKLYMVHRIVFALHNQTISFLEFDVDHIDGDRSNNKPENLRLATRSNNCCNTLPRSDNSSGYKGVYYRGATGKWQVQIMLNGKRYYLGQFNSLEDASTAYAKAAENLHGEFART